MVIEVNDSEELAAAAASPAAEKEIILAPGRYTLTDTLELSDNTILRGNGAVLTGAKRVSLDGCRREGELAVIDLRQAGMADWGQFGLGPYQDFWKEYDIPKPHMEDFGQSLELYYQDQRLAISRYPADGFIKIKQALGKTDKVLSGKLRNGAMEGIFVPAEREIFDREDCSQLLLVGYWSEDWAVQRHRIERYEDGVITVNQPYHVFGYRDGESLTGDVGSNFYVLNAKSAVQAPGQWCIDRSQGLIYLYPVENQAYVDISVCENIIHSQGCEHISVENIRFTAARRSGMWFTDCRHISITGCQVDNVGNWGIVADRCGDAVITGCTVSHTGAGGIAVSGGDRASLAGSGILVSHNQIHDIAYWHKTYMAGIEINGVGITVRENKIWDVPHFGITFQGNDHIIEQNEIKNACYESNDAGAVYAGRDWTCQGNIIRYNYIHDLPGFRGHGCIGIYFDDGMSCAEVYGNIIANQPNVGIMVGGGRGFDIHDNYFCQCKISLHFDRRVLSWGEGAMKPLVRHLHEMPYQSDVWRSRYPLLYTILEDEPMLPKHNRFADNMIVGGLGLAIEHRDDVQHLALSGNRFVNSDQALENDNKWLAGWTFINE